MRARARIPGFDSRVAWQKHGSRRRLAAGDPDEAASRLLKKVLALPDLEHFTD